MCKKDRTFLYPCLTFTGLGHSTCRLKLLPDATSTLKKNHGQEKESKKGALSLLFFWEKQQQQKNAANPNPLNPPDTIES